MVSLQREREAKLAMLEAIARSQLAVARMLESTADVYCSRPVRPEAAVDQLARLAALQQAAAASLGAIRLREIRCGTAAEPWLAPGIRAHHRPTSDREG